MNINLLLATLTCVALAAFTHPATAAPGDLDLTFGGTGKVMSSIGIFYDNYGNNAAAVAIQSDGRILLTGTVYDFLTLRYNNGGGYDGTFHAFGSNGSTASVAAQNDGKFVIAGNTGPGANLDFTVIRYNSDGSFDASFNGTGNVTTDISGTSDYARSIAVQSDQKIVVAGETNGNFAVVRYNSNGSLDTSFNGSGKVTTNFGGNDGAYCVVLQNDGKIVVAGSGNGDFAVVRYNWNGSLDTSFNGTGKVTTDFGSIIDTAYSAALQSDGKIVVTGLGNSGTIARYNTNGSLDTTFNGSGKVTTGGGRGIALQDDGKMVVINSSIVSRYKPDGSLDVGFGNGGSASIDFNGWGGIMRGIAVQPDGNIVIGGHVSHVLALGDSRQEKFFTLARLEGGQLSISGSQTVNLGAMVVFSVDATGSGSLTYQWKKDGVGIPGATANSYAFASAQPWHIGNYTVVVTDSNGSRTSSPALLQINGIPTGVWRGLVAFYPFDGDALDREVGGANATVSGAVLTTDRLHQANRAFDFDGINDQMTATVPNLPVGSAPRTISLWAKARPDPARSVGLVEWGLAQNGRAFGVANSNSPYTWNGKTYGAGFGVNSGAVVDSKWHHLCLTYEGGILSIFLDGVLKQTKSEAVNTGLSVLTMGVGVEGSTFYPGSVDEVRIYNRALSPSEIQQLNTLEDPDTDGDGIRDRFETGTGIYVSAEDTGTSPTNPDSDGDGLNDGQEVNTYLSNPNITDTDGDGFGDGFEVSIGFSPTSAASTPDALSSIRTAAEYRFNAALGVNYRIESSTDLENWTTIETPIIGTGGVITRFYSVDGQAKRFYRSRRN